MLYVFAVVTFGAIVAGTTVHAQDLALEWLGVRATVDGVPATAGSEMLAERYGVAERALWPGYFPTEPEAGAPAQALLNLPLLFVPFDWLPAIAVIWTATTAGLFAVALARLARVPLSWMVAALPLLLVTHPGLENLKHGQFGFAVAALLAWTWLRVRGGEGSGPGPPVGVAVGLKANLWLVLLGLSLSRWKAAAVGFAVAAGINLFAVVLFAGYSFDGVTNLAESVVSIQTSTGWNGSLVGRLGWPWQAGLIVGMMLLLAVREWPFDRQMAVIVPASLLLSPIALAHYLPVLLVPVAALRWWGLAAVLVGWWLIPPAGEQGVGWLVFGSLMLAVGWGLVRGWVGSGTPAGQTSTQ